MPEVMLSRPVERRAAAADAGRRLRALRATAHRAWLGAA